jgi:hypothetical protein
MPTETAPKQEGQTRTARADPQYLHDGLSGATEAPQLGQLKAAILVFADRFIRGPSGKFACNGLHK